MLAIFLDTETSGLNPFRHHVLEVAFKIVDIPTDTVKVGYESIVFLPKEQWKESDPSSLKVNGFSYEIVKQGNSIESIGKQIIELFGYHQIDRNNAVFICQNPSFDRIFFSQIINPDTQEALKWPYHWLDLASMYWLEAMRKGKKEENRLPWITGLSKDKIAQIYKLPAEKKPHRAMNGVDHLILCYRKLIEEQ